MARLLGAERREPVYLVGGVVRDLLLGRGVRDVDLVVEGDAAEFAAALGRRLGAERRSHARFATATLTLSSGGTVDVAAARTERYPSPGALPEVSTGASIEEDLARRDFTIHAMARELGGRRLVVDPFGGRADLGGRRIRALHAASFRDDPTRMFRAVRYGNRLGFRLAPETRRQLAAAVDGSALDTISGDRLRRELRLLFGEEGRTGALARLESAGLDRAIDRALSRRAGARIRLRRLERAPAGTAPVSWIASLLAWLGPSSVDEAASVSARLALSGTEARILAAWPEALPAIASAARGTPPVLRRALRGRDPETIAAVSASLPAGSAWRIREAAATPAPRLSIRGADLRAAGVPAGPTIGRALARTREALEEGRVRPEGELAFALRAAREEDA